MQKQGHQNETKTYNFEVNCIYALNINSLPSHRHNRTPNFNKQTFFCKNKTKKKVYCFKCLSKK